jgi:cytochrome c556
MRPFHQFALRSLLLIAGGVPALACVKPAQPPQRAQQESAVAAPKTGHPPEPLSPVVQALLKQRMVSHSSDMNDLVSAIMLLDYQRIADRAEKIASDANLSRPISGDATELNASLPEKFFVYQDRVKFEARGLMEAAGAADPYQVASKYGRLAETCVGCHADYRPRS